MSGPYIPESVCIFRHAKKRVIYYGKCAYKSPSIGFYLHLALPCMLILTVADLRVCIPWLAEKLLHNTNFSSVLALSGRFWDLSEAFWLMF